MPEMPLPKHCTAVYSIASLQISIKVFHSARQHTTLEYWILLDLVGIWKFLRSIQEHSVQMTFSPHFQTTRIFQGQFV